jgi:hypothetical protein
LNRNRIYSPCDDSAAGSGDSTVPIAQAKLARKDWLSLLTKSSDVNGLTRGKHARFARYRIFQDANFKKKHASS